MSDSAGTFGMHSLTAMVCRKHVLRDLRPYVCTSEFCLRSEDMFSSRREWFEHERGVHRRAWHCDACETPHCSAEEFAQHLRTRHADVVYSDALVQRAEKAIEHEQSCPLCRESHTPRSLRSHLGRHMQQIALFTLPVAAGADGEEDSDPESALSEAEDSDAETSDLADAVSGDSPAVIV